MKLLSRFLLCLAVVVYGVQDTVCAFESQDLGKFVAPERAQSEHCNAVQEAATNMFKQVFSETVSVPQDISINEVDQSNMNPVELLQSAHSYALEHDTWNHDWNNSQTSSSFSGVDEDCNSALTTDHYWKNWYRATLFLIGAGLMMKYHEQYFELFSRIKNGVSSKLTMIMAG